MSTCSYCNEDKPEGKVDSADAFWCSDCIDDEDMGICGDCGEMFPSSDMAQGSAHGNVCKKCHEYRNSTA